MLNSARQAGEWWNGAAIYQILPLSFQDTIGDGEGDLPEIIARLEYLDWLGVDAVWLSPVYRSPMCDAGYDVAEFTDIDPRFGTVTDLKRLISELHERKQKIILDIAPNHTSDRHPWFTESRASQMSAKRDWYIWAAAAQTAGPRITG
ncbi:MAG: hypothetical protein JO110_06120 [Acetobacteraceae bacterium]|nr:hypothetical protein [Acetobacteraceae bacterium]